ncbi:SMR domain protein [Pseudolysobacter antarcticus]|uniref:SMR domain protein n=1 Tax=Pseudolysobacter antarcticus TaxID=2511995 RepID=A0A411HLF8_9GAMM|nr:Smr/MutS family protein [Pseudolysobacter antarcticus]QBB71359.1 SMR domain protein [Pseudolysobacter antarcticus]
MKRSPKPSPEDVDLFHAAVGPLRRLRTTQVAIETARREPVPEQFLKDEASVSTELMTSLIDPAEIEVGEELSYLKAGVASRVLRQLKRGHFSIDDEFDLHQMTAVVAREAIASFLNECRRERRLCVKIIHGKGLRSKADGPVLKRLTDRMLRQRDDVLAYASAKSAEGGTGAVLVLLKRP